MIDAYASLEAYADHISPIWAEIPARVRGTFWAPRGMAEHLREAGIQATVGRPSGDGPIIIAGFADMKATAGRRVVFVEHGAGQTYGTNHPSYPGGAGRGRVVLFVCPSERVAKLNLDRYPSSRAVAVGCPRLDRLHLVPPPAGTAIGLAWHWNAGVCPEATTAWPHYREALAELAKDEEIVGTAHPRIWGEIEPWYRAVGIRPVRRFEDLARAANVLLADNTSAMYEWASLDRPLVVANAPWYRRGVHHGGRFWNEADMGVQVDDGADLRDAIAQAQADSPSQQARRREVVAATYSHTDGHAAERAAEAVLSVEGVNA